MNVRLHIEHLVLDSLPVTASQGPRVKVALEADLAGSCPKADRVMSSHRGARCAA